ncbi:MAG: DNA cytosine methyltransferase [Pyrinomonadaceae bacterium]
MSRQKKWPTVVDLFSGCGAVTEALKRRHFRVVAAIDSDPIACRTYRTNHPRVRLYEKDLRRVSPSEIRVELLRNRNLDLLVVCAPCQPFSSQGRKDVEDARVRLILSTIRFASVLMPKLILFENVPGLATPRFVSILDELRHRLSKLHYRIGDPQMVDAADYGVPQRRERCILIARRMGEPPRLLKPTTPPGNRKSVRCTIEDLPRLGSGEKSADDPLHFSRRHHEITLRRLSHIPKDGGSRFSLPKKLVLKCHENHSGHPDVYGRMSWDDVAPTLTTGCTDLTRGRFAHPTDDRAITLREAARLQTFGDNYRFEGNFSEIATQIGNAVPVRLIEEIAPVLRADLWGRG